MATARPTVVLAVLTSVGALVFSGAGANAATKPKLPKAVPYTFTDPTGDANGLNSQGDILPADPETPTPSDYSGGDITSVVLKRVDNGKSVQGISVTMNLAGAPSQGTLYRVTSAADACSVFWFQYSWAAGGTPVATLRNNCAPSSSATAAVSNTVSQTITTVTGATSITWVLPLKEFPAGVKLGSHLSSLRAETRFIVGAGPESVLTLPVIDQTKLQTVAYKLGS